MKKYNVIFNWNTFIDFNEIQANNKTEAIEKAKEQLITDHNLYEELGKTQWKAKEIIN